uniref:Phosphoserine phosphatase n=2 Tax=Haematobia irritans TaxID=7368 RepID=A0A1L8EF69_HAEIR
MNSTLGLSVGRAATNGCTGANLNGAATTCHSAATISTTAAGQQSKSKCADLAVKIIQKSHIVCFDVDSTLICEEGIDELADFCNKGSEVARVTKEAMGGTMTFQDALKIRLDIIKPSQKQIFDFLKMRPCTLTHNVKRFVEHLKAEGKQVYLISGGFHCLIEPLAIELGIPLSHIYANKLMFFCNGEYAAFDANQPTSRSGGKAEAISMIRKQYEPDTVITMIGDGATDLEAVPPANYFVGFGGNVLRPEVHKRAQYYVTDFEQLMQN